MNWNGQIIAGYPDPAGGNATIAYENRPIPGAIVSGNGITVIPPPTVPAPEPAPPAVPEITFKTTPVVEKEP